MIGDDEFWRQLRAAEARALEAERTREADEEWALEDSGLTRYLLTCHLLDNALKVDYNGSSTGSQTQARYAAGRACLLQIVPWKYFPTEILAVLDELSLSSIFHEHFSATVPDEMLTPGQLETGLDGQFVIELSHVMDKSHQTGDVFVSESRSLAAAAITQLYAAMI
ncbi:hypothetical protein E4U34_005053 [Claviceps purpurea]|nr:hypothetical protein E4U34_005053 [Claviceps purpurea]